MRNNLLYVDDEPGALKSLKRIFRDEPFGLVTYESPIEALDDLEKIKPAVVISDQCMPEMDGIEFLEKVKIKQPDSVRILLTGLTDLEVAVAAINQGNVYRYIQKPWDNDELKAAVESAFEHQDSIFCLRQMVESLVEEVMERNRDQKAVGELAKAINVELGQPLIIITGYIQLLQQHLGQNDLLQSYLSNIIRQIKAIEDVTKSLDKHMPV